MSATVASPESSPSTGIGRLVLTNSGYALVAEGVSKVISLCLFLVMVRELGPSGYGTFAFAVTVAALALTLGNFGQDQVLVREVAPSPRTLYGYFGNTLALKLLLATPTVVISVLVVAGTSDRTTTITLVLICCAGIAELITATNFASYQAFEQLKSVAIVRIGQSALVVLVGVPVLLQGGGVIAVSVVYAFGAGFGAILSLVLLHRISPIRWSFSPSTWTRLAKLALPVGLAGVLASVLFRLDIPLLMFFENSGVVGQYAAAYRLLDATLFLTIAVGAAAYPVFCRLTPETHPSVGFVLGMSLKLALVITIPLAVATAILAGSLVEALFGAGYEASSSALRLLAPTIALFSVVQLGGLFLIGRHRARAVTKIYAFGTVGNLVLNLALIPALSLRGAALSTSVCELGLAAALLIAGRDQHRGVPWASVLLGPIVASILMGYVVWLARDDLTEAAMLGFGAYVVALFAFERTFHPHDFKAVLRLLRPPRSTAL